MKKDIILPSRRFIVSRASKYEGLAMLARLDNEYAFQTLIGETDLLPMARALVEIYEVIQAEKVEAKKCNAQEEEAEYRKRNAAWLAAKKKK